MARELTPLKVVIRLNSNGQAKYPNFNILSSVMNSDMDWSRYVDAYGLGWHYDKTCGHKEDSVDSPIGTQIGILVVPEEFANEAVAEFPDDCSIIKETELEDFYNNKAHIYEPDEIFNMNVLEGIQMKKSLDIPLTAQQLDAINPDKDTPGICKNKNRYWADYKIVTNVTIKEEAVIIEK
jgi:hypothetical protein